MASFPPSPAMLAMRVALIEAIRPFTDSVSDTEKVAILGHMIGGIVALGSYDEGIEAIQVIDMVMRNMEAGNAEAIAAFSPEGKTVQ